jgi:sulfur-carrier protein
MTLSVKFIGAMRHTSGKTVLVANFEQGMSLKDLLSKMGQEMPQLEKMFCDQEANDSASNALVLINGREISVLDGLETKLQAGDEIVFIPVVHGG